VRLHIVTLPSPTRAVPPLPLAGEGWGEGNLEGAPRQLALTLTLSRKRERGKGTRERNL